MRGFLWRGGRWCRSRWDGLGWGGVWGFSLLSVTFWAWDSGFLVIWDFVSFVLLAVEHWTFPFRTMSIQNSPCQKNFPQPESITTLSMSRTQRTPTQT